MNDLPSRLRKYYVNGKEWYGIEIDVLTESADHIEAQEKLIEEMREALGEALSRLDYHDRGMVNSDHLLSKSNPNTPERNDK